RTEMAMPGRIDCVLLGLLGPNSCRIVPRDADNPALQKRWDQRLRGRPVVPRPALPTPRPAPMKLGTNGQHQRLPRSLHQTTRPIIQLRFCGQLEPQRPAISITEAPGARLLMVWAHEGFPAEGCFIAATPPLHPLCGYRSP